jgi:segregation and condensation protein B
MPAPEENRSAHDEPAGPDAPHCPTEDHDLSVDELSAAFARMMGRGRDDARTPGADAGDASPAAHDAREEGASDDCCEVTPRSILEAMLFVGDPNNEPITSKQVASLMRGVQPREIDDLVVELNEIYDAEGCPYRIASVGAGYRMALRDEYASLRDKFYGRMKEARLSQAAIEVLAIVAYRQPLTRQDVDELRGKSSGALLSQLVRRRLLCLRRSETEPRVARYYTAERFLELFGLENLGELPQSHEFD